MALLTPIYAHRHVLVSIWAIPEKKQQAKHKAHVFDANRPRGTPGPLGANFDGISGTNKIGRHSGL
eukprot:4747582-Alexandrium_andersonii.AAC.1